MATSPPGGLSTSQIRTPPRRSLTMNTRTHDQYARASPQALATRPTAFVGTHEPSLSPPQLPPSLTFRPLHLGFSGSPSRGSPGGTCILSLNSSPGMSEGLSVQHDDSSRPLSGNASTSKVTVRKWRFHFAKPPSSAMTVAPPKPVTTATPLQKLELDEDAVGCFLVFLSAIYPFLALLLSV
jgi:hypothetical protein